MQKISIPTLQDVQLFRNSSSIDQCALLKKYRDAAQSAYVQLPNLTHKDDDWRFIQSPNIKWDTLNISDAYVPKIELGNGAFICDLRDFFHCNQNTQSNVFSTLVNSSWNRGYVLYIPKNVMFDQSIDLYELLPVYDEDCLIEKVVIQVESGAHVKIKDVLCSAKTKAQTVIRSVDLIVQDNAQVTFVYDQNWDKTVCDISTIDCTLGRDSQLDYNVFITGGTFTKQWLNVDLCGQGARAHMRGAYVLNEQQQVAINALQNHFAPYTNSDLIFKGVVAQNAQAVYQGTIFIDKNAHNSDAIQKNKNILLSDFACVYSIPNLQVLNNDVQCAHGSAVGQLDAEQLFYAQVRGLSVQQAQQLLLKGFLQNLFQNTDFLISNRLNQFSF